MKNGKAARAMEHLDDALIVGAMQDADLNGEPEKRIYERKRHMMKHHWTKWVAVAAAVAIIISVGLLIVPTLTGGPETVIALDVNPSIELSLNQKEEITDIRALNAEAEVVLGDMNFKGVDLDVGINAIIGSMLKNGYLSADRNSILVSVDSSNAETASALQERLSGEINALLGGSNITASVITQEFDHSRENNQKAEENNISPAKATLISKIVAAELLDASGVPYTYEVLAKLNVHELKLILESKSVTVEGIQSSGTASDGQYITREQALSIALAQAGIAETDMLRSEVEMDFDDDYVADGKRGVMVYEIEVRTATMKYEYELLATDGTVLEAESRELGKKDDDDDREKETFAPADEHIDRNAALAIAYADANVTESAVKRPEIELDREKGIYVYEIEFKTADREYEYTIHAVTGEILEREIEPLD